MDTGGGLAHNHDVGCSRDANPLFETPDRQRAATRLLCDQRLNIAEGTHSLRLYFARLEGNGEVARTLDRDHPSSIGSGADGPFATASFVRSESCPYCRDSCARPRRYQNARSALQGGRCQQEVNRETLPKRNRHDLRKVAAENSAHARNALPSWGCKGDAC